MDYYGFYTGKIFDAYTYLGAHVQRKGVVFRTFAPSAIKISVTGEFNNWKEQDMLRIYDGNFWECYVEEAEPGMMYKYKIYHQNGTSMEHCDPYGYGMELRPNCASIIRDMRAYTFHDEAWMKSRTDGRKAPLNIYEIHMGSFRKPSEKPDAWYNYAEVADLLIPYMKEHGYNYVEVMPLNEYPSDESWGYQSTGFYSPTSRFGTADQLKEFVDRCHQAEIGVIIDFVPVHFAVDGYALHSFDGTAVYEYPNSSMSYSEWGSNNFMHSRGEVRSFLQSAANYWLSEYHFDGLRMDAISRIIYWQGDENRGVNHDAIHFLQHMNQGLKCLHPTALLAAEDSTSYPGVTKPTWADHGLGFDYKWDMGWMNDTLNYFRTDPQRRIDNYHKLTFSMMYYYNDNFMLPLSHDEVVHGKATIMQKMNGQYEEKFPQARAMYMYMYAHPGKKLNFMGNEIGQLREWDEKREQDWFLLKYPNHDAFHRFMTDLNKLYLENSAFWEKDFERDGFEWLDCHSESRCTYAMERRSEKQRIVAVFNFSQYFQDFYVLNVPKATKLKLLLCSNTDIYGGNTPLADQKQELDVVYEKVGMALPPFTAAFYLVEPVKEEPKAAETEAKKTAEKEPEKTTARKKDPKKTGKKETVVRKKKTAEKSKIINQKKK